MTRIYVTSEDPYGGPEERLGYFDSDRAERWVGDTYWDGSNHCDRNTSSPHNRQTLYRTAQGRWVICHWSNWVGAQDSYHYLTDEQAQEWLLFNGHDEAAERFFGPVAAEKGPGRPEIGNRVTLALGDLLPELDAYAKEHGQTRAEAARTLLHEALNVVRAR